MSKAEIIKRPIEKIGGEIKRSAWESVLESLAILILGILFVAWPETMITIISYLVGTFFVVKGAIQIISYFIEQGQRDFFNNNLLFGVISVLAGIIVFVLGGNIADVFRIALGILLIYAALVKINTALKFHSAGLVAWKFILIFALVVLILGVFVVFNNVASVIGWIMIVSGVISMVSDLFFIQDVNNFADILTGKVARPEKSEKSEKSAKTEKTAEKSPKSEQNKSTK